MSSILQGLYTLLLPFQSHKYLLYQLTQREIKARYKQSFVGYAWVLINPLAQMLVYTFVFSVVIRFPTNNIPYPIFLFVALLPWTTLQLSVQAATLSLVDNQVLLKKVRFPREIIPYSVVVAKIIDFCFSSLVFVFLLLLYQLPLVPSALLFIPLFCIQTILTLGLSLLLSAFNLFYRDIQYVTNLLLLIWMYITPIVYPLSLVPEQYVPIYTLNPMVGIIEGYRAAVFGLPFAWEHIVQSLLVSIVVFVVGYLVFKKTERVFADIV